MRWKKKCTFGVPVAKEQVSESVVIVAHITNVVAAMDRAE